MSYKIGGITLTQEDITTIINLITINKQRELPVRLVADFKRESSVTKMAVTTNQNGIYMKATKYLRDKYFLYNSVRQTPDGIIEHRIKPSLKDMRLFITEIWLDHNQEIPEDAFIYG
jgi:hypothetical protein